MKELYLLYQLAKKITFWVLAFTLPIQPIMWTVFALIAADFITGIISSIKLNGWRSIRSSRMGDTVIKLFLYELSLILSYVCELYILPYIPLVRIVAGFIALTELKSFAENVGKATGKDSFYKYIKSYIKSKFKSESDIFNNMMNEDKK